MGSSADPHVAAVQATLDGRMAHRPRRQGVKIRRCRQFTGLLGAEGKGQATVAAMGTNHGPSENHRFSDHQTGRTRFGDLQLGALGIISPAAYPPLALVEAEGPLLLAPAPPTLQQAVEIEQRLLLRWGQFDQLIGIGIGEPVGRTDPAALQAVGGHRAEIVEFHPEAPGRAAPAADQAEGTIGQLGREHWQGAAGQIKTAATASGLQIEGAAADQRTARVGHMDPEARPASRSFLQRQAVIDVEGVFIIDRDRVQVGEIEATVVTGLGFLEAGEQPLGFRQQIVTEAVLPGGGLEGGQVMTGPLAEIGEQVADGSGIWCAVGGLQPPAQVLGQGLIGIACGPAPQQGQVFDHGAIELLELEGASPLQGGLPLLLTLKHQCLLAPLAAQLAQFSQAAGLELLVSPTEVGLGALEPEPAGSPLGRIGGIADQIHKRGQIEGDASAVAAEQKPGSRQFSPGRQSRLQAGPIQIPGGMAQLPGGILGRTGADQLQQSQGGLGWTGL